eukprot:GHVU01021281.1.p4 GENE.GHVU01021281.1~~GHVU01021281.1.p4  ORF type:complete len:111 (+),score=37.34 GHVU01021281.1:873-1205(+)
MDERMNEQKLELELRPAEDIEGVTRMAEEQAYNDTQRWGQAVQVALGRMRHKHRIYEQTVEKDAEAIQEYIQTLHQAFEEKQRHCTALKAEFESLKQREKEIEEEANRYG